MQPSALKMELNDHVALDDVELLGGMNIIGIIVDRV
jgi:hypothetical protein